jgi:muramoyltetrapeptide carboxypeptidase LdcA involved in peptidoglycan recycling
MLLNAEFTLDHFRSAMFRSAPFRLEKSDSWSDDSWRIDQHEREFRPNPGPRVIRPGRAVGRMIGGHLSTFSLLRGTRFMPDLSGAILIFEEDGSSRDATAALLQRHLYALSQTPSFRDIRGLVFGRFPRCCQIPDNELSRILETFAVTQSVDVPIVADIDCGHTTPMLTWPSGAPGVLVATRDAINLEERGKHSICGSEQ